MLSVIRSEPFRSTRSATWNEIYASYEMDTNKMRWNEGLNHALGKSGLVKWWRYYKTKKKTDELARLAISEYCSEFIELRDFDDTTIKSPKSILKRPDSPNKGSVVSFSSDEDDERTYDPTQFHFEPAHKSNLSRLFTICFYV